jgi:CRP-like cAMP-binding protein
MEAVHDPEPSSVTWVARLVELLQPLSVRADRLAGIELFAGLRWSDLELAAALLRETEVDRGTRMTVQGRPVGRFWVIIDGEALVSANARPLRVAGYGDTVGLHAMLDGRGSPETTIALCPLRALAAGREQFRELVSRAAIRSRFAAAAREVRHPRPRRSRRRSSEAATAGLR